MGNAPFPIAQAIYNDNKPYMPPIHQQISVGSLALSTPVNGNHTLLSAISNTLHPTGVATVQLVARG